VCSNNERYGISVGEQAQPDLESIAARRTTGRDRVLRQRRGHRGRNGCQANVQYGITVAEQASPTIEANSAPAAPSAEIGYFEAAPARAPEHLYRQPALWHLSVRPRQATLEGNVLQENGLNGLIYQDNSGGIANNNQCTGNGRWDLRRAAGDAGVGWQSPNA